MFKSIRFKLVAVYFLLVFLAMMIIGLFITDQMKRYYMQSVRNNLTYTIENVVQNNLFDQTKEAIDWDKFNEDLSQKPIQSGQQYYIIDTQDYQILASTQNESIGKNALIVLDRATLLHAHNDQKSEFDENIKGNPGYQVKHVALSLDKEEDGQADYIIYAKANLQSIFETLKRSTEIVLQAAGIGLIITIILSYLMAGSIARPINYLSVKAMKMAKGDFNQKIQVKSDDEIGQLGQVFNFLTSRLAQTLQDISSEKNKLDAIIYHMKDAVVALDGSGRIIHSNPSFTKAFRLDPDAVNNQFLDHIIAPYCKELEFGTLLSQTMQKNEPIIFEARNQTILKAVPAIFRDGVGKNSGVIIVFQDITENQRLEEMRKDFVANVSHELKTPITTIKTYSETLLSGAVDDPATQQEFLRTIEHQADQMSSLVKDLLFLSQMDYRKTKWELIRFDINPLIRKVISDLNLYTNQKNQTVIFEIGQAHYLFSDPEKINQVVTNLISNAVKYTPQEGRIEVRVKSVEQGKQIIVSDSGIGIPKEDIPRIFERFYRVDKGRSREQGGTGLGLSIVKNIVEEMGGRIHVDSHLGQGTSFTVWIPDHPASE